MMKRKILALLLMSASFTACKKSEDCPVHILPVTGTPEAGTGGGSGIAPGGCIPPQDCKGILCSAVFSQVVVSVSDASGAPVALDSFVVTDLAGTPLPPATSGHPVYGPASSNTGDYAVINDAWVGGHQNNNDQVIAKGYLRGAQVFSERYTILADCCHVSKAAGKDTITLP